jgi:hypothetical protein
MAMKIIAELAHSPEPPRNQALMKVHVNVDGPREWITFMVLVPRLADTSALIDLGKARSKDIARRFAGLPSGHD